MRRRNPKLRGLVAAAAGLAACYFALRYTNAVRTWTWAAASALSLSLTVSTVLLVAAILLRQRILFRRISAQLLRLAPELRAELLRRHPRPDNDERLWQELRRHSPSTDER